MRKVRVTNTTFKIETEAVNLHQEQDREKEKKTQSSIVHNTRNK